VDSFGTIDFEKGGQEATTIVFEYDLAVIESDVLPGRNANNSNESPHVLSQTHTFIIFHELQECAREILGIPVISIRILSMDMSSLCEHCL
jgi:hypothetical protein